MRIIYHFELKWIYMFFPAATMGGILLATNLSRRAPSTPTTYISLSNRDACIYVCRYVVTLYNPHREWNCSPYHEHVSVMSLGRRPDWFLLRSTPRLPSRVIVGVWFEVYIYSSACALMYKRAPPITPLAISSLYIYSRHTLKIYIYIYCCCLNCLYIYTAQVLGLGRLREVLVLYSLRESSPKVSGPDTLGGALPKTKTSPSLPSPIRETLGRPGRG